jgi:hypothetical protein
MQMKHPANQEVAKVWKRVGGLLLEVLIAITVVASAVVYVASHPANSLDWGRIALYANTGVVFGFLVWWFREKWKELKFWTGVSVLLLVHLTGFIFAIQRIPEMPLVYYAVLNPIELSLVVPILRKLLAKQNYS